MSTFEIKQIKNAIYFLLKENEDEGVISILLVEENTINKKAEVIHKKINLKEKKIEEVVELLVLAMKI